MRYRPELDGLRTCAVTLVVARHAGIPFSRGGSYGVDVFFVLSGYLITRLLLTEWRSSGDINLRRFYARRALRLYPALLLCLVAYVAMAPFLIPGATDVPWQNALLSALYLTDYTKAFTGFPHVLAHSWSLSVEEHFYVLWPVMLLFQLRRGSVTACARTMFWVFLALTAWRVLCASEQAWREVYFRFDTRASGLALGCAYSLWCDQRRRARPFLLLPLAGIGLIVLGMYSPPAQTYRSLVAGESLIELSTLAILHGLTFGDGPVKRFLSLKPMAYLGRLSYGIYLWHYPIVFYLASHHHSRWATFLIAGGLACGLSALSYATLERFTRRISARLKAEPQPAAMLGLHEIRGPSIR